MADATHSTNWAELKEALRRWRELKPKFKDREYVLDFDEVLLLTLSINGRTSTSS